jgi:hypothetical protein
MNKQEQQQLILNKIEAMVNNWAIGDVKESQKNYEYIIGFCESANYDFTETLNIGLHKLMQKCVGIQDTMKYVNYINGV